MGAEAHNQNNPYLTLPRKLMRNNQAHIELECYHPITASCQSQVKLSFLYSHSQSHGTLRSKTQQSGEGKIPY